MTNPSVDSGYGTYGFHFTDDKSEPIAQLDSVGHQFISSTDYYLDGLKRQNLKTGRFIFQYTISGWGVLIQKDRKYIVGTEHAFFAQIPDNHIYFFDEASQGWEFIFIALYGSEVARLWPEILKAASSVAYFKINSRLINLLFDIYKLASHELVLDKYQSSGLAYGFLMELLRSTKITPSNDYPVFIQKSIDLMLDNYQKQITIGFIASTLGISENYYIRHFVRFVGTSPGKYLSRIRMKKAVELLLNTKMNMDEVALQIGYANGNYFNKVFRNHFGISPGSFRGSKSIDYTSYTI